MEASAALTPGRPLPAGAFGRRGHVGFFTGLIALRRLGRCVQRPTAPFAVALTAAAAIAALAVLESPWVRVGSLADSEVHVVLISLASIVTATLGLLAMRAFYATGSSRSLALGTAMLAFAAVYIWHGVYTTASPAFAFLIYGPMARAAAGMAILFMVLDRVVAAERRFLWSSLALMGAVGLAALAGSLHPALSRFALGADGPALLATRLAIESVAGAAMAWTLGMLLLQGRGQRVGANVGIAASLTLLAAQSLYFLASSPWTVTWWAAHAIGAAATVTLTAAVIGQLMAAERSRELDQLSHLNTVRTRFINSAAHELGTPLTPIQLQLSLLRSRPDPLTDRQRRSLDTIQRNVDRLADLTRSILEGARAQDGQFPIRLEPADLHETMDDLERSYTPWCAEKDLRLSVTCSGRLETFSDRRRIHQIVSNFISNAIKNTAPGGSIDVTATGRDGRIRIEVRDTGRGMTELEQHRLFQPFTQLEDPSKLIGSGLGLFITKQLAARLGGDVGVESKGLGHGSTFYADLPAIGPNAPEDAEEVPAPTVAAA